MEVSQCDWSRPALLGMWPATTFLGTPNAEFHLQPGAPERVVTIMREVDVKLEQRSGPDGVRQCRKPGKYEIVCRDARIFCVRVFEVVKRNSKLQKSGKYVAIASGVAIAGIAAMHGIDPHLVALSLGDGVTGAASGTAVLGAAFQSDLPKKAKRKLTGEMAVHPQVISEAPEYVATEVISDPPWRTCRADTMGHVRCG